MNNTKTLAIAAIFMAATLVVGTFATTTTITTTGQSAFAYSQKKKGGGDNGKGNGNGNTVTIEECKNKGSASGFDTTLDQECENLICTHPGENATCTQEGAVSAAVQQGNQTTPVNKMTCEQCFTSLLTVGQINTVLSDFRENSIPNLCSFLQQPNTIVVEDEFRAILNDAGVTDIATQNELIACLKNVGIVFPIDIG
jgi:hypothetical protein